MIAPDNDVGFDVASEMRLRYNVEPGCMTKIQYATTDGLSDNKAINAHFEKNSAIYKDIITRYKTKLDPLDIVLGNPEGGIYITLDFSLYEEKLRTEHSVTDSAGLRELLLEKTGYATLEVGDE